MPIHSSDLVSRRLPSLLCLLLLMFTAACRQQPAVSTTSSPGKPRIISLAPSTTEMLYAIGAGDQLVGRTSACDWPQEAKKVPVIGAFGKPSLELLAAIKPDLIVDIDLDGEVTGKNIGALGLKREHIACRTPDDVPPALRKLGRLSGHVRQADSLAEVIEKGLAAYRKAAAAHPEKKKVYLEIWDDPLWTGGRHSFTAAMVSYAGGRNIGDEVDKEYFEVSPEWVIRQNPDIIACMYMANQTPAAAKVRSRPGWQQIGAVRNNRVYDSFDNRITLRPGPRILEGIAALKAIIDRADN